MLLKHKLNTAPSEMLIMAAVNGEYAVVEKKYSKGKRPFYAVMETFSSYSAAVAFINTIR